MNEFEAERLKRQIMLDYDADPGKLTDVLDELRELQEASGNPEELIQKYQKASAEIIDFFDRLRNHAESEASNGGELVDFTNLTLSQVILACVRGYPDYRRAFEGTNSLLNEEMETSRKLGQQIFEITEHYEGIIHESGLGK